MLFRLHWQRGGIRAWSRPEPQTLYGSVPAVVASLKVGPNVYWIVKMLECYANS
jgi:hypothetical protein